MKNAIIQSMLNRKSIRFYKQESPTDEIISLVVRAGQQAPFSSQLYSLLLSRNKEKNPFKAPLLFTICIDSHKLELIMARRNWKLVTNDLSLLLPGIQDASLMAENMVIAAESLNLGSCFLGNAPYRATKIVKEYKLPERVFPLVQLVMGYPAENPPPRPRYPQEFVLFEDEYPNFSDEMINKAISKMDEGYLAQDYYKKANLKIPLQNRKETFTFDNYGWTEHISRKCGQRFASSKDLIEQFAKCGFHIKKTDGKMNNLNNRYGKISLFFSISILLVSILFTILIKVKVIKYDLSDIIFLLGLFFSPIISIISFTIGILGLKFDRKKIFSIIGVTISSMIILISVFYRISILYFFNSMSGMW